MKILLNANSCVQINDLCDCIVGVIIYVYKIFYILQIFLDDSVTTDMGASIVTSVCLTTMTTSLKYYTDYYVDAVSVYFVV